jgi:hypothetical protein
MRRFLITIVVVVIVVGAGLFGMDRALAAYAEDQIKKQTSQEVAARGMTSGEPSVDVGGFPFINQVVSGEYDKIVIKLPDLTGEGVKLSTLTLVATTVKAPLETLRSGRGEITAGKVTGTSLIPWDVVVAAAKLKNLTLAGADDGTLKVSGAATFAGFKVPLTGAAKVTLVGPAKLRVSVSELAGTDAGLNSVIKTLISGYKDKLVFDVAVPKLPYDLKLSEVRSTAGGLDITAYADDVPLTQAAT